MGSSERARAGMTLVEAMVAVAVVAMIGAVVWGGVSQTTRARARVEAQTERYQALGATLERICRDLAAAFVSLHLNPDPALQRVRTAFVAVDRGHRDRVDFTSFSHVRLRRDAHESDQHEVGYFMARDPEDQSRWVLARREQRRIDDDPLRGGKVYVLLRDVEEFDLTYLDPVSGEWITSWDSREVSMQPNRLPAQVKIRLQVTDPLRPDRSAVFGTRATIGVTWGLNFAIYNP